ncbi:MAG: hypothetical protein AAF236_02250 [Verrucomicrobiota bacterium]
MEASGIENAECLNCQSCHYVSDGDYGEHRWHECSEVERYQYLKSFPFKKTMDCWRPDFFASKFAAEDFDPEEGTQYEDRVRLFNNAVDPILEDNSQDRERR